MKMRSRSIEENKVIHEVGITRDKDIGESKMNKIMKLLWNMYTKLKEKIRKYDDILRDQENTKEKFKGKIEMKTKDDEEKMNHIVDTIIQRT